MNCEHAYSREADIGLGFGETRRRNFVSPDEVRVILGAVGVLGMIGALYLAQVYFECSVDRIPPPRSGKRQRTPKVRSGNTEIIPSISPQYVGTVS